MFRILLRLALITALVAGCALAAWAYSHQGLIERHVACLRLRRATSPQVARQLLGQLDAEPDHRASVQLLVSHWGTGSHQLDEAVARYLVSAAASDTLREAFSLEMAWRPELLPRWAHCWAYLVDGEPREAVDSILGYVDTLAAANAVRPITWRDVLDLQAAWQWADCPELAVRLTPENYRRRWVQWNERGKPRPANVVRPKSIFGDGAHAGSETDLSATVQSGS